MRCPTCGETWFDSSDEESVEICELCKETCTHANTTGYMWRDRPSLGKDYKDWQHAFTQPGKIGHHDRITCDDCGAWLPLGESNDEPEAVKVEMRAVEIADLWHDADPAEAFDFVRHLDDEEIRGWSIAETNTQEHTDRWHAGYLAREHESVIDAIVTGPLEGRTAEQVIIDQRREMAHLITERDAAVRECGEVKARLVEREAQLDATRNKLDGDCTEHVELNGHLDIAEQCRDWLSAEADIGDDPSGKMRDFAAALSIVIDQCTKQWRRANWYICAYDAGRAKLVEYWQAQTAESIAAFIDAEAEARREEGFSYRAVSDLAADIRAGTWRKEQSK